MTSPSLRISLCTLRHYKPSTPSISLPRRLPLPEYIKWPRFFCRWWRRPRLSFFCIAIHWLYKTQPYSLEYSTYSEVHPFYLATKMVQWLWPILQKFELQVSNAPTPIYEDSQPTIDIITSKHLKDRAKQNAVPFHYFHGQYDLLTIYLIKLKTTIQLSDIGGKSFTGPLLNLWYSYICGAHCYLPLDKDNYHRLALDTLSTSYHPTASYKYL